MITSEELAAMKARLAAILGGWNIRVPYEYDDKWYVCTPDRTELEDAAHDAEFIYNAPTDMERLIAEVERLTARNYWLNTELSVARERVEGTFD